MGSLCKCYTFITAVVTGFFLQWKYWTDDSLFHKTAQKQLLGCFWGIITIKKYKTLASCERENKKYQITQKLKLNLANYVRAICNDDLDLFAVKMKNPAPRWNVFVYLPKFAALWAKKLFCKLNPNKLLLPFVAPKCAPIPRYIASFSKICPRKFWSQIPDWGI